MSQRLLPPPDERPALPLSPEQSAVWAIAGAADEHLVTRHSRSLLARITGVLAEQRLLDAVAAVMRQHEIFQYAFVCADGLGSPRQQLAAKHPVASWDVLDWRNRNDLPGRIEARLTALREQPFDLAHGESLRAVLIRCGVADWIIGLAAPAVLLDQNSLHEFLSRVVAAYAQDARAPDDESSGAEAPFQYSQYIHWREELAEEDGARDGLAYWTQYLLGAPAAPRLSYRREPALSTTPAARPGCLTRTIDATTSARLRSRAQIHGVTLEVLYQSIWWALLMRITGCQHFIGGWRHDCRSDYEPLAAALGVFDRTLPLIVTMSPDDTLAASMGTLATTLSAHIAVQEYWPVEAPPLQSHLGVGFDFVEPAPLLGRGTLQWSVVANGASPVPSELVAQVTSGLQHTDVSILWDSSHYTEVAATILLDQYVRLLSAQFDFAATRIADLPLARPEEQGAPLAELGPTTDYGSASVGARIARWALTTPDAPALEYLGSTSSYHDLHRRAGQLGSWLQRRGVTANTVVALELPRSAELVLAMLAVWRIGAAFLPLEPAWPPARRRALLADAKPVLLLRDTAQADGIAVDDPLPEDPTQVASWGDVDFNTLPDAGPDHVPALHDLAYVLYTSGSTGTPKGVLVEHGALLNYVSALCEALSPCATRRWGLLGSMAADLGYTSLFGALFDGACLVVAGASEAQDGDSFARFVRTRGVEAVKIVPSHLDALLESEQPMLPRTLILGGEATSRGLLERVMSIAPACRVFNHYGPTETTVGVMIHEVSAADTPESVLPLTRVLANNRVYILDDELRATPIGALGGVYVSGAQVCRGYVSGGSEGRFVPHPHRPGERLYRTGDLAYRLPEGGIRLAGRADQQLKIQGFRVEPAEIEAILLEQPDVRQAAVVARAAANGAPELVAFVVATAGVVPEEEQRHLRQRLAATLPAYMRPGTYVFTERLPRLPNGKIDRLALGAWTAPAVEGRELTPPRDPVERLIVNSMAELLGRSTIGVDEDFFDLGGHSLLVIKLVARVRKGLGIEILPELVFDHSTPAALARALPVANDSYATELRA